MYTVDALGLCRPDLVSCHIHCTTGQDPAGNIQLADGTYHVFPCCKWEHFASRDLVHWEAVGPTNLGGGTGSMAVREDGSVIAMAMAGGGGANLHVATDRADCKGDKCLSEWKEVGAVLNSPKTASGAWLFARVGDPARPWKARDGHWYACNHSSAVRAATLLLSSAGDKLRGRRA